MTRGRYLRSGVAITLAAVVMTTAGSVAALATPDSPWALAIRQVDTALARKEYSLALRAANERLRAGARDDPLGRHGLRRRPVPPHRRGHGTSAVVREQGARGLSEGLLPGPPASVRGGRPPGHGGLRGAGRHADGRPGAPGGRAPRSARPGGTGRRSHVPDALRRQHDFRSGRSGREHAGGQRGSSCGEARGERVEQRAPSCVERTPPGGGAGARTERRRRGASGVGERSPRGGGKPQLGRSDRHRPGLPPDRAGHRWPALRRAGSPARVLCRAVSGVPGKLVRRHPVRRRSLRRPR